LHSIHHAQEIPAPQLRNLRFRYPRLTSSSVTLNVSLASFRSGDPRRHRRSRRDTDVIDPDQPLHVVDVVDEIDDGRCLAGSASIDAIRRSYSARRSGDSCLSAAAKSGAAPRWTRPTADESVSKFRDERGSARASSGFGVFEIRSETPTIWITPPVFASACRSIVHIPETLHNARAAECDAMIGAFESAAARIIDPLKGWDTSTIRPTRFISASTSLPNGEMPFPHL
jgi:hypothetical protein